MKQKIWCSEELEKKYNDNLLILNENHKSIPTLKTYVKFTNTAEIMNKICNTFPKTLISSAFYVYSLLLAHCNDETCMATVSQRTLAQESKFGEKWISKISRKLEEHGFIVIKRRGQGECNVYDFVLHRKFLARVKELERIYAQNELIKKSTTKKKNNKKPSIPSSSGNNYYNNKKSIDSFNNFDQRSYDFEDLERKLLGWDNNDYNDQS